MREWRGVLRWASTTEREQVLADANAWQEEERAAARERIIGVAAVLEEPLHAHPKSPPELPLLTPGQAARTQHPGR